MKSFLETKGSEVSELCRIRLLGLRKENRPKVYTLPFLRSNMEWKKEILNIIFVGIAYVRDGE
jgi:hypothetical protein